MKFNIHLRSTFKLWNRKRWNIQIYEYYRVSIWRDCLFSMDVFICLGVSVRRHWREKQMIMTGICQSFVVWPISVTDMPTYKTYTYFFILFVHRNSIPDFINTLDGNTHWERISLECQVQSTSIQQKKSFTPFYNVIFITFDIYHKNYTITPIPQTKPWTEKKQIQTLYIFVNQIITSQLLVALFLLSLCSVKKMFEQMFFQRRVC